MDSLSTNEGSFLYRKYGVLLYQHNRFKITATYVY